MDTDNNYSGQQLAASTYSVFNPNSKEVPVVSQELLDKAKGVIAKGTKMIESNDQSKDQIKLKCDEIRELCDKFEKEVQKREDGLKKAMDIHECLEMVLYYYHN